MGTLMNMSTRISRARHKFRKFEEDNVCVCTQYQNDFVFFVLSETLSNQEGPNRPFSESLCQENLQVHVVCQSTWFDAADRTSLLNPQALKCSVFDDVGRACCLALIIVLVFRHQWLHLAHTALLMVTVLPLVYPTKPTGPQAAATS